MSEKRKNQVSEKASHKASRLFPIDALRGLVIVFMALDHANHFVAHKHPALEMWGGGFPVYDDSLAFITRLIAQFVAPGFSFLMGVGMLLFAHSRQKRGWSKWAVIQHFLIRGGVLIAMQLLIVNRAWELSGSQPTIYIGVLFALGGGMILGSPLLWIRPKYLLLLAGLLFLGMELLHPHPSLWDNLDPQPLNLLFFYAGGDSGLWSNYPILPWLELVVLGIAFGYWLEDDLKKASERAIQLGKVFLLAFVVIRYLDGFGNIRPRMGNTWIDFLNVVKYPPSMTFTLLTMGVNLIVLGLFARANEKRRQFLQPLAVLGRAPLFFYVTHLFLYAGLGLWLTPNGTSIPAMYPLWLLGLLILFPLCLWFGQFKDRQPANSISRFL